MQSVRQLLKKARFAVIAFFEARIPALQLQKALRLAVSGSDMSEKEVQACERILERSPEKIEMRFLLLGKYFHRSPNGFQEIRLRHIIWILENRPEHPILGQPYCSVSKTDYEDGYAQIESVWLRQVERRPKSLAVLENAGGFFTLADNELAEGFYIQALELEPRNERIRGQLAHLYSLWDGHEVQALEQLIKLCDGRDSLRLFSNLTKLPSVAFAALQFDTASSAADRLLKLARKYRQNWNYGNAVNEAHTILGRIAIQLGDLESAKRHLEDSIIDIATPQTTSFGPSLDLAKDLVENGEATEVLHYLDNFELLCGLNNRGALELRDKLINGGTHDPDHIRTEQERDSFDDFCRQHQWSVLQSRSPSDREKHLKQLIRSLKGKIEIYSRRSDEETSSDPELDTYKQIKLQKDVDFLAKLEALKESDQRS